MRYVARLRCRTEATADPDRRRRLLAVADQTIMLADGPGSDSQALPYGIAALANGLAALAAAISGSPGSRYQFAT